MSSAPISDGAVLRTAVDAATAAVAATSVGGAITDTVARTTQRSGAHSAFAQALAARKRNKATEATSALVAQSLVQAAPSLAASSAAVATPTAAPSAEPQAVKRPNGHEVVKSNKNKIVAASSQSAVRISVPAPAAHMPAMAPQSKTSPPLGDSEDRGKRSDGDMRQCARDETVVVAPPVAAAVEPRTAPTPRSFLTAHDPSPASGGIVPQDVQTQPSTGSARYSSDWQRSLHAFANRSSVELEVLCDQEAGQTEASNLQLLPCHQGDLVAGISMTQEASVGDMVWCVAYVNGVRAEGVVPRTSCRPCGSYEFMLQVSLSLGTTLGLQGSAHEQGLEVEELKTGGIIEKWNRGCALSFMRDILRRGDVIVSANGHVEAAGMLTSLRGCRSARLRIVRLGDSRGLFGPPQEVLFHC